MLYSPPPMFHYTWHMCLSTHGYCSSALLSRMAFSRHSGILPVACRVLMHCLARCRQLLCRSVIHIRISSTMSNGGILYNMIPVLYPEHGIVRIIKSPNPLRESSCISKLSWWLLRAITQIHGTIGPLLVTLGPHDLG